MRFNYLIIALLFYLTSCGIKENKNTIVFSCIFCKGCITRQLDFIEQNKLDAVYQIIIDTNCLNESIQNRNIHLKHMDKNVIKKKYGEFGNLLYFDSTSKRIELMTNMELSEIIK